MTGKPRSGFSETSDNRRLLPAIGKKMASCPFPDTTILLFPLLLLLFLDQTEPVESEYMVLPVYASLEMTYEEDDIMENRLLIPLPTGDSAQDSIESQLPSNVTGAGQANMLDLEEHEVEHSEEDKMEKLHYSYARQTNTPTFLGNTEEPLATGETDLNALSNANPVSYGSENLSSFATCNKLSVSSVTASGSDGNIPANVIDNNLNTRWSNNGAGSWIQLDLGSTRSICSIELAWYRGNIRANNFVISVSQNGNTFTNIFSGTSSGSTESFEKYNLPAGSEGRYVRVTVNGNTESNWASITEAAISGSTGGSNSGSEFLGSVYHKWQSSTGSSTWSAWNGLGGATPSTPTVTSNTDGRLEVFAVGSQNALYHKWQTSSGSGSIWSGWSTLGGAAVSDANPAIIANSDGRLEVFLVGAQDELYHKWQTSPGSSIWSQWFSLEGGIKAGTNPAVTMNSDGRLEVFVIGADNKLYHKWQTSPGSSIWSQWISLDGTVKAGTDPEVLSNANGRLVAFVVGADNELYHKWQSAPGSSTWTQWSSLGGSLRDNTNPVVGINNDGRLEAFVINDANQLYHKSQISPGSSNIWTQWMALGGSVAADSGPEVGINSDGRLEVFVVDSENTLFSKKQTSAGSSSWSQWNPLGGTIIAGSSPTVAINSDGRLDVYVKGTISEGGDSAGGGEGDAGTNDKFGMKKFYNSNVNGQQWYLGDPGLITGGVTIAKPSHYYETTSTQVRLRVGPPSAGYHPEQISTLNQNELSSKGYMQSPYDWKNVEITGRFRVVSYTDSTTNGAAHIELSARGGTHTSSAPCEGTAYHGNLYVTGRSKFEKELMHPNGYATNNPQKVGAVGPLQGKWFDFKHVIYTLPNGHIKLEQYYREDVNGQWSSWQKIFEHSDTGSWGEATNNCGGTSNHMIKWGGPLVFFRWDNIDKMQFYNLSVREIVPS
jgi:F5/8 type C domain